MSKLFPALKRFQGWFYSKAWPSYLLLSLIQLKVIWGIAKYKDLTTGDTSSYFVTAHSWAENFGTQILWSPLYTSFYGSILLLVDDIYAATTLHRIIIVFLVTLGVLALMRRLLPPGYALLLAVWWAVLPINFDTLYEVHLFAALPILAILIISTFKTSALVRGLIFASLCAATVLIRNELLIAAAIFGVAVLAYEIKLFRKRREGEKVEWNQISLGYGVPVLLSVLACVWFYQQSNTKYPQILASSNLKHTLNMCQVYAFGFSQRQEWNLSPWVECYGLMETTFGKRLPTLGEMILANPQAALEHLAWNASLIPNGIQVSLFNAMSGTVNPDYALVQSRSIPSLVLTFFVLGLLICAAISTRRNWDRWRPWFADRRQLFFVMGLFVIIAIVIMITQRPRPSYLFGFSIVMMSAIGIAGYILTRRWIPAVNAVALCASIAILVAVPSYYQKGRSERPLRESLQRLQPFQRLLLQIKGTVLIGDYEGELVNYLRLRSRTFRSQNYSILSKWDKSQQFDQFVEMQGFGALFLQPRILSEMKSAPGAAAFLENPQSFGWTRLSPPLAGNWLLLAKTASLPGD